MLKEYKRKFIFSNMLLVGSVVFVMLCAIFVYFYNASIDSLKNTMSQTLSPVMSSENTAAHNSGQPPSSGKNEPPRDTPPSQATDSEPQSESSTEKKQPQSKKEPPRGEEFKKSAKNSMVSVIFYNPENKKLSVLSSSIISDEQELQAVIETVSKQAAGFGKLPEHKIYYFIQHTNNEDKIAIAGTGYILSKMAELFLLLLLIFVCTMLLFYFISKRLARLAIQPLELSIRREKQLVADISHDLKTPIAVILANIGIIKSKKASSDKDELKWLNSTAEAANSIKGLVNQMLELSEMDYADKKIELSTVNLSEIVQKSVLFMESVAYEGGIEYEYTLEDKLFAETNAEYADKIFVALIENALKYEKSGGKITIRLYREGNRVLFSINNRSSVISAEDLPFIFERFYRSDKARQANGGHGLGLAIVKATSQRINASVAATSDIACGTTFTAAFRACSN